MASDAPQRQKAARHASAYLVLAALVWLWPFFLAGWKGRAYSFLPKAVTFQYNAAGLFTKRANVWWDHHVEIGLDDGTRVELDERSVFPMGAFGYRTRLDRILNESNRSPLASRIRQRLSDHVAAELRRGVAGIEPGRVERIFLVRSVWRVGDAGMARPAGAWNPPPSPALPARQRLVLGSWAFAEGRAAAASPARTVDPPPAAGPGPSHPPASRRRITFPQRPSVPDGGLPNLQPPVRSK